MMEYGLMMGISPREPLLRFSEVTMRAEELGFDMAWVADSQLIMKDAPAALSIAAAQTERIKLGPGVTNPVTRHFTTIANWMVSLNELSDGRAVLGIGPGDSAVFPLGLKVATTSELRTAVEDIRALGAGQEVNIGERPVRLLTAKDPFPIFIAASQPRMLRLAGATADGVILMGGADPRLTQWQLDHIAAGATEAGRTMDDVFVDLWFGISISEDLEQARLDVRSWVTSQARWFAKWKELPSSLQPHKEEFTHANNSYAFSAHLSRHAEHSRGVSDSLVDLIAVCGPLERCVEKIEPLLNLKVDRLTWTLLPGGRMRRLQQLGEQLIPALTRVETERTDKASRAS